MRCTKVMEPSEPHHHHWRDNYICVPKRSKIYFKWSYSGPRKKRRYNLSKRYGCIRWLEKSDPHTWADNYLCGSQY